jgi:hypothetical protein
VHASVAAPRLCCPAVAVAVGRILSPAPRLSFCLRHALPFLGIALPWPEIMESLLGLLKVRVVRPPHPQQRPLRRPPPRIAGSPVHIVRGVVFCSISYSLFIAL